MEKEGMILLMEVIMMDNGIKIRLVEQGLYFLRVENLNMKDNGEMIYTMAGVPFIIKILLGLNTRENLKME